jgi:hypothetical protein
MPSKKKIFGIVFIVLCCIVLIIGILEATGIHIFTKTNKTNLIHVNKEIPLTYNGKTFTNEIYKDNGYKLYINQVSGQLIVVDKVPTSTGGTSIRAQAVKSADSTNVGPFSFIVSDVGNVSYVDSSPNPKIIFSTDYGTKEDPVFLDFKIENTGLHCYFRNKKMYNDETYNENWKLF